MDTTTEKAETAKTLLEIYQTELHQLIEQMNEYQAELVLAFIKTLFGLAD